MSNFKGVGGRYGMHSGSGHWKNIEVDKSLWVNGSNIAPTFRTVLYVSTYAGGAGDGSSWDKACKTIQQAVDLVTDRAGTLILVGPGKYQENVLIEKNHDAIYIKAVCGPWETQLRVSDGTTKHTFTDTNAEAGSATGIGMFIGARNVTVDGFCFDGGGGYVGCVVGDGYGVGDVTQGTSQNAASCRIINCLFTAGNEGTAIPALVLKGCSDNVIVENNVFRTCDYGIYISSGSGKTNQAPIIRNNHFIGCSTYGVYKCNENTDLNVQVIGNTFLDGGGATMTFAVKFQGTGQHFMAGNWFGCTNSESLSLTDFASGNFLSVTNKTTNATYVSEA
jgi:hypothetical protein